MKSFSCLFLISSLLILNLNAMEKEDDPQGDLPPPRKKMRLNPPSEKEKVYSETTSFEQLPPKGIENVERVKWYTKAAEQGHANAQCSLGGMYLDGRAGIPKGEEADHHAVKWYTKAAEQGHANARNNLGFMYAQGRAGIPQGEEADHHAVKWFTQAAEQGHANAQCSLGGMYLDGRAGIPQGEEADHHAAKWFTQAAEQGNAPAQFSLGVMYQDGRAGIPKGEEADQQAFKWYTMAAEQGHANAQCSLGGMYLDGRAGIPKGPEADQHAFKWYTMAAEQGHATAQFSLGGMYLEGSAGIPQGPEADQQAVKWCTKAAEQGHATAQFSLGGMYAQGRAGIPKGEEADHHAVKWYTKAAEQGHATAQGSLGVMYQVGRGATQNYQQAVKMYTSALKLNPKLPQAKQALQRFFTCDLTNYNPTPTLEGPQTDIENLKESLESLKDHHIFLEGFAGGGFGRGFGENSSLKALSHQIGNLSDVYIKLVTQINEPGFLISCLKMNPTAPTPSLEMVASKKSIADLYFKLREDLPPYLCLTSPDMVDLLKSAKLHEKLEELYGIYESSITILQEILISTTPQRDTDKKMEGILLGLKYAKESQHHFLKAFLEPYYAANEESEKRLALQEIIKKLKEHRNILQDQRELCKEINSMILGIIKESEAYRNHLFITRIWNG
ncbi:SEL1-like repeat protein [Candidatus Paracaedibacter symbiosus]|uniref:SEL1-like repeat protein n=1 Tax=Candidatus Paracaedibacter symbiosus TaxID=244582 RepID=UPI0006907459|nr:SEL1-like repeat protein [Candidatus Paracaedibacter symbiosus]